MFSPSYQWPHSVPVISEVCIVGSENGKEGQNTHSHSEAQFTSTSNQGKSSITCTMIRKLCITSAICLFVFDQCYI